MTDDTATQALIAATEARARADGLEKHIASVSNHLVTIGAGIEAMRRENREQHAANARKTEDAIDKVHGRISSVKAKLDELTAAGHGRWVALYTGTIGVLLAVVGYLLWPYVGKGF